MYIFPRPRNRTDGAACVASTLAVTSPCSSDPYVNRISRGITL